MEILYTKRYKINFIFSLIISGLTASLSGFISPFLLKNTGFVDENIYAVLAAFVFVAVHFFLTNKYRKRKKILSMPFPVEWKEILSGSVAFYRMLDDEDKFNFEKKIQIFLAEKIITGIGTDIDDRAKLLIASAAIIPVFKIEDWEYHSLEEILVYPHSFDENFSFTEKNRNILGMVVHNTSSLIISKKDLFRGFSRMDGENTAIHEFIHKIDEEDGDIDGLPVLMLGRKNISEWKSVRASEMKLIEQGKSDINPYALTGDAEFLAVSGEYFFDQPEKMKEKHPELYSILKVIFNQDMASIIKSETLGFVKKKKR
jgi:MtfA peptidase